VKQGFVKIGQVRCSLFHQLNQQPAIGNHLIVRIAFQHSAAVALQKVELLVDFIGFLHKNSRVHVTFRPETIQYQTLLGEFRYFLIDASDFHIAHGNFGFEIHQLC